MRLIVILLGLTAISVGIGGVFANLFHGEGYLALAGLAISFTTLTLGLILFIMGVGEKWNS
jgi:uncharacterized transporter YbjL